MPRIRKEKDHALDQRHEIQALQDDKAILALLKEQLFKPAKAVDGPLVKECLLALDPALEEASTQMEGRTWARIQERIAAPQKTISPKRLATAIVLAVFLLAMAAVALAIALGRLSIQFPSSVRPYESVTEEAKTLIQYDLAVAHFAHVDIEVREALYDGAYLRLVYSVRDTRPGAELAEEDIRENIITAAQLNNLHCCDWIEVDGKEIYLWDTFQRPGELPGEMLYYLGINVTEQGVFPQGEMTVGLPMLGYTPHQQIPDDLRFTVKANLAEGLAFTTDAFATRIAKTEVWVESGEFTPTGGRLRLVFFDDGTQADLFQWRLPLEWEAAGLYSLEGEKLGFVWDSSADYDTDGQVSIDYKIMPPAAWPERMILVVPGDDGMPAGDHIELHLKR